MKKTNLQIRNLILVPCAALAIGASAQNAKVTGVVTDDANNPLIGVNVVVKGSSTGTITDADGRYELSVPKNATLEFSYLGMSSQTLSVGNNKMVNVVMVEDAQSLDEMVVIGYGQVKKRDLTGAVSSLKAQEVTATPVSNVMESLQGKVAGLDMTKSSGQAGAGLNFSLRGNRSLNASNAPLILVDGITYGSTVDINPSDIESVEVLKDASSTAIYGTRGANGVILITTKKGKAGKPTIYANVYAGIQTVSAESQMMSGPEFVAFRKEAYRDDPNAFSPADQYYIDNKKFVDWQKECIKDGSLQSYEVGVAGGNDKSTYNFSLGIYDEQGLFKGDNMRRYNGKVGFTSYVLDNVQVGGDMLFTYKDTDQRADPLNRANKMYPWGEPYNEDGSINLRPAGGTSMSPMADEIENAYLNNTISKRFFGTAFLNWEIVKGLMFRSTLGVDNTDSRNGIFWAAATINGGDKKSHSQVGNNSQLNYTWENTLNYNKTIGVHDFGVLAGMSLMENRNETSLASGDSQASELNGFSDLASNTENKQIESNFVKSNMASWFGRINYQLMNRYLFTASLRADGSSVLAKGHKWGYFPSVAAAWRLNEEEWLNGYDALSNLKLRASWGKAGNSAINPYSTIGGLSSAVYAFGDALAAGYYTTGIENPDLTWETTATTNIGLDFGFFKNRLAGSIEFYVSNTSDLLMQKSIPVTSGFTSVWSNVGKTKNTGLEINLNTVNFDSHKQGGFKWTTDITFYTNKEEIVELASGADRDLVNGWFVGEPTTAYYDYEKIGIWQTNEADVAAKYGQEPGDIKVRDVQGDGVISADQDRVIVGSPRPDWSASMNNHLSWKNFDFSVFMYARVGQTIISELHGNYKINAIENTAKVDYWTPTNPTNDFPRPDVKKNANSLYYSTLQYQDGSFLKIRDITLGYSLPKNVLAKTPFSSVRIYSTMKNFLTFSKFDNYDPERGGNLSFPMTKSVTFGLNVQF